MSVTFSVRGEPVDFESGAGFINLANANARDLLGWLGYEPHPLWGELAARELAARCRRRLWDVARNQDPARPGFTGRGVLGCRCIVGGRDGGYLRERTVRLLAMADRAGEDGAIVFD
jgi:hypothetical protein